MYECVVIKSEKLKVSLPVIQNNLVEDLFKRLVLFADVISVANNISIDKARIIATMFYDLDNVKECTREQLEYFFKKAFNLEYGALYGGFGWNNLVEWFNKFYEELEESKKEIKVINREIVQTERNVLSGQDAIDLLHGMIDKNKDVPKFMPWLIISNYLIGQDSEAYEDYVSDNYDKIRASLYGKSNNLANDSNLGRKMEALRMRSEQSIDEEIKTNYAKDYARKYFESKFSDVSGSGV